MIFLASNTPLNKKRAIRQPNEKHTPSGHELILYLETVLALNADCSGAQKKQKLRLALKQFEKSYKKEMKHNEELRNLADFFRQSFESDSRSLSMFLKHTAN